MKRFSVKSFDTKASQMPQAWAYDVRAAVVLKGDVLEMSDEDYAAIRAKWGPQTDPAVAAHLAKQFGGCSGCGQSRPDEVD